MTQVYQNTEILAYARDLALRDYDIVVSSEVGTGGKIIYTARTPELDGCKAQGYSVIEAVKSLIDARIDYIYDLVLYGRRDDVAPPNAEKTGEATYVQESAVIAHTQNISSSVIEISVSAVAPNLLVADITKAPSIDDKEWRHVVYKMPMNRCVLLPVRGKKAKSESASKLELEAEIEANFNYIYNHYRKSVLALVNLDESEHSLSSHAQTVANCYAEWSPWNEPIEGYTVSVVFLDSIKYVRIHKGEEVVYAGAVQ